MKVYSKIIIVKSLFFLLFYSTTVVAQIDTVENYFPTKVGTTWVYRIYPQFSNERERQTITKDSISSADSSHFLFINNSVKPKYRIDASLNVFIDPLGGTKYDNQLIFKQKANKLESWAFSDSAIDGFKRVARIKEVGYEFIFGRFAKYKQVEWGEACEECLPDSFGLPPKSEYYAEGFGLYFVIVEPPSTERSLVGFISEGDTLGDITKVINFENSHVLSFVLHQNYPNPFNSSTTVLYELKSEQFITLKIFDILGRELQQLIQERQSAGEHKIRFKADGLHTGMYFLQLRAGDKVQVKKLLYLK